MDGVRIAVGFAAAMAVAVASASAQCPGERVIPPVLWVLGQYGRAVQIEGAVAIAGDPADHTLSYSGGAAHTFRRVDGRWRFEATLFHSRVSPYDGFGNAISLDGSQRFAASAPGASVVEVQTGAVYLFEHDGKSWREVAEIPPAEPMWSRGFGSTLVLRGDTLVVGQPRDNVAWVYRETGGRWEFVQKLEPPDLRLGAKFSNALALDGEWLVVGARLDTEGGHNAGAAYIYRQQPDGTYGLLRKLLAPGDPWNQVFGDDIALDGMRMAIGAPNGIRGVGEGAVYLYELGAGEWRHVTTLQHDEAGDRDHLGSSVSLGGDIVIAGAPDQPLPSGRGAAYLFHRRADGTWRQDAKLLPETFTSDFGAGVATDGVSAIVGAPDETVGGGTLSGAAHIFDLGCLLCRADLDGDGELTFFDFITFGNLFAAGDPRADFDGSGALDFFDFLAFQTAFAAGCD